MRNVELILDEIGSGEEKRKSIENQIMHKAKIRIVAYNGGFDGLVTKKEIHIAKIRGLLPNGFEVHHIIPLNCKNTRLTFDNMLIMDSATHRFLHKNVYDVALRKCKVGQLATIFLPDFDINSVVTYKRLDPRFIQHIKERQRE